MIQGWQFLFCSFCFKGPSYVNHLVELFSPVTKGCINKAAVFISHVVNFTSPSQVFLYFDTAFQFSCKTSPFNNLIIERGLFLTDRVEVIGTE